MKNKKTRNSVGADPKELGIMKQSANALGITNVGTGHKWRLEREMNEVFSGDIARESGGYGPHSLKPLACHHLGIVCCGKSVVCEDSGGQVNRDLEQPDRWRS